MTDTQVLKRDKQDSSINQIMDALHKAQAIIEFELDGTIITANENFLKTTGYALEEIQGMHHRMFCDEEYASSPEYQKFWNRLGKGEFIASDFQRFGKDGQEIWINASYNPVFDSKGKPSKVIKFASDITESKNRNAEFEAKLDAVSKAQAVIEFELNGKIITANENFLKTTGYSLEEIQGQHHRMFCDPEYAASAEYTELWERLGKGEVEAAEFQRFGKGGREIWINASYNPVFDAKGKPVKIVKFASDITERKNKNAEFEAKLDAISKSQAVIEFEVDGTIITANENFLATTGYSLEEIQGKHHRMFCDPEYVASSEYKGFWERLGNGEFIADEFQRYGKDGSEVWISASYNPVFDAKGRTTKVVKFATDITDQVAIRKQAQTLSLVANETDNSVIICDKDGRIEYCNPGFVKLTGYSFDECRGKKPGEFLQGKHTNPETRKRIRERLDSKKPFSEEILNYNKAGEPYWISLAVNPVLDSEGEVSKFVSIQTDITTVKLQQMEFNTQLDAISKSSAIIQFTPDGNDPSGQ